MKTVLYEYRYVVDYSRIKQKTKITIRNRFEWKYWTLISHVLIIRIHIYIYIWTLRFVDKSVGIYFHKNDYIIISRIMYLVLITFECIIRDDVKIYALLYAIEYTSYGNTIKEIDYVKYLRPVVIRPSRYCCVTWL